MYADDFITNLFTQYYDLLYNILRAMVSPNTRHIEQIDDCLQYTFLQAWIQKEKLKEHPNISGWLYTTAKNKLLAEINKEKRRLLILRKHPNEVNGVYSENDPIEKWQRQQDAATAFDKLYQSLTETEKLIFTLKYINGKSNREISSITDMPEVKIRGAIDRIHLKAKKIR